MNITSLRRAVAVLMALACLSTAFGLLAPAARAHRASAEARQTDAVNQVKSPCDCTVGRAVSPAVIKECETSTVTVTLQPACPGQRIHVVYIIDEVYKPNFSNPRDRLQALRQSVQRLKLRENPHIEVAVVWMQRGTSVKKLDLTNEESRIISFLDPPEVSRFAARQQCFDCGFREANRILERGEKEYPDDDVDEIVVLAPLGVYTAQAAPGVTKGAQQSKARGAVVLSTCFAWTHCDAVLRRAASQPRYYLAYGEGTRLASLIDGVVQQSRSTFLRSVTLVEQLPDGLEVVSGTESHVPDALDPVTGARSWNVDEDDFYAPLTITYQVRPTMLGEFMVGEGSMVMMQDSQYREIETAPPTMAISVSEPCAEPTPLPTATPVPPTDVPPTPTDLPPTATSTAVPPTATPRPQPIYLPISVRERCRPDKERADVILVLDASTSMAELTRSGRSKIEAAAEAAQLFVNALDFEPNGAGKADQAALVSFNADAQTHVALGRDRAALTAALGDLALARTTRLDLGISAAMAALEHSARDERNTPVIIVLTDGRANPVPVDVAVALADEAKQRDVLLYAVALGDDVDEEALQEMASHAATYRRAPDGEDLAAIYQDFTDDIPCRSEPFWPASTR